MPQLPPSHKDVRKWAHWWADKGWAVFPVCSPEMGEHAHGKELCNSAHKNNGKWPLTKNGFKDASVDHAQIDLWWDRHPQANIGGTPPEGQFVVDIDGPSDVEFPTTWEHSTGKGKHLVFTQHPANPIPQGQRVWPNVDTRLPGKGYVILPPSMHVSGKRYAIADVHSVAQFPVSLSPAKTAINTQSKTQTKTKASDNPVLESLRFAGVDGEGRDENMIRIAGYLARYVPDQDVFAGVLEAINRGWHDPLDATAMGKKFTQWERHQEGEKAKRDNELDDEKRGWLYEAGGSGYASHIDKSDGTFDVVEFSDFRVQAKGLIIAPDSQTFIVDFTRSDGSVLENAMLESATLAVTGALRKWLANRGMVLHSYRTDKRGEPGMRLLKLLQSQNPPVLQATEYYGWNDQSSSFITETCEICSDGSTRGYSTVYPLENLNSGNLVKYGFELGEDEVKDLLRRTLALNEPTEMAKLGAWLVMTLLRGQYQGNLPGLLTSAFSGTGKSTLYEIITGWLGYPQHGGKLTAPVFRDMLSKSYNAAVWLDDFTITDEHATTLRAALTTGQESKMVPKQGGSGYESKVFQLRGSIIISDEGNSLGSEKANRDRLLDINLQTGYRTTDGEALKTADVAKGAGTLVSLLFKHRGSLDGLDDALRTAVDRASRWRVLLAVGAKILSDVLEDDSYVQLVTDWAEGRTRDDHAQASVLAHDIIPALWRDAERPNRYGFDGQITIYNAVWFNVETRTFWLNCGDAAAAWLKRPGLSPRQRQLGTKQAIQTELCALRGSSVLGKGSPKGKKNLRYHEVPAEYTALILDACEVDLDEDL